MNVIEILGNAIRSFGYDLRQRHYVTPPIYVVTCMKVDAEKGESIRQRTWGWFVKRSEAEKAAENNYTDMFEHGYYDYCVVEAMEPGCIATAKMETWFAYQQDGLVERCEKPECLKQIVSFGMG